MPTPKTWTDRAADILLDERNKRYLGMTPRRRWCDHGMSSHSPDGCTQCDCKVPGFRAGLANHETARLRAALQGLVAYYDDLSSRTTWVASDEFLDLLDSARAALEGDSK